MVSILPNFQDVGTVFSPIRFFLSTLLAHQRPHCPSHFPSLLSDRVVVSMTVLTMGWSTSPRAKVRAVGRLKAMRAADRLFHVWPRVSIKGMP